MAQQKISEYPWFCSFIYLFVAHFFFIPPKKKVLLRAIYVNWHAQSARSGIEVNKLDVLCLATRSPFIRWTCWKVTKLRITNRYKTYYATVIQTKTKAIKLSLRDNGELDAIKKERKTRWNSYEKGFSFENFWICAIAWAW